MKSTYPDKSRFNNYTTNCAYIEVKKESFHFIYLLFEIF
jgi:hypothetical protein